MESEAIEKEIIYERIGIQVPERLNPKATGVKIITSWDRGTGGPYVGFNGQEAVDQALERGELVGLEFDKVPAGATVSIMYAGERKIGRGKENIFTGCLVVFIFVGSGWKMVEDGILLPARKVSPDAE